MELSCTAAAELWCTPAPSPANEDDDYDDCDLDPDDNYDDPDDDYNDPDRGQSPLSTAAVEHCYTPVPSECCTAARS